MIGDVETDAEGFKKKLSKDLEIDDQALVYTKIFGVYNRDPRNRDLFQAFVLETFIHLRRKVLTWDSLLKLMD